MNDPYNLQRFIAAQDANYEMVIKELKAGQKKSHWMWYIFPQIAGLGHSATAQKFAIHSKEEAVAYITHPVLGIRLKECAQIVVNIENRTAREIFGYPDDLKFRSSMTLFHYVARNEPIFQEALTKYYAGEPDRLTIEACKHWVL